MAAIVEVLYDPSLQVEPNLYNTSSVPLSSGCLRLSPKNSSCSVCNSSSETIKGKKSNVFSSKCRRSSASMRQKGELLHSFLCLLWNSFLWENTGVRRTRRLHVPPKPAGDADALRGTSTSSAGTAQPTCECGR